MTDNGEDHEPMPGIRSVLIAGFVSGNVSGLFYLLLSGRLLEPWWMAPLALLVLLGAMMGVGVVGTLFGTLVGLSGRMLLHGSQLSESWWPPVILSGLTSAAVGWCIAEFVIAALS